MAGLKLGRLPDRSPVKITITIQPDLNKALHIYAGLYREAYGEEESVATLIPYMLQDFLGTDRSFSKVLREKSTNTLLPDTGKSQGVRRQSQAPHRGASSTST